MARHIVTTEVAASCYPRNFDWKSGKCLVHAVEIDEHGEFVTVLCRGVKLDSLLPDSALFYLHPLTCPRCLTKLKPLSN